MQVGIQKVTPFTQEFEDQREGAASKGVAAVTLMVGPVQVQAKLYQRPDDSLFLLMPSRKGKDDKWFEITKIMDYSIMKGLEERAIELYRNIRN